eukprot:2253787-Prymnesium_polylepis.1
MALCGGRILVIDVNFRRDRHHSSAGGHEPVGGGVLTQAQTRLERRTPTHKSMIEAAHAMVSRFPHGVGSVVSKVEFRPVLDELRSSDGRTENDSHIKVSNNSSNQNFNEAR